MRVMMLTHIRRPGQLIDTNVIRIQSRRLYVYGTIRYNNIICSVYTCCTAITTTISTTTTTTTTTTPNNNNNNNKY
jgi:hypothetical protein